MGLRRVGGPVPALRRIFKQFGTSPTGFAGARPRGYGHRMTGTPLTLYNSLTRSLESFRPIDPTNVRVYSCGPTVYNYVHVGNLRAYVFTDTLSRVLTWKGYPLTHVINITDVGHLTSDADAGDDKMEAAAKASAQSIWDIAAHYTAAFKENIADLNIRTPTHFPLATDHIQGMIAFAEKIAPAALLRAGERPVFRRRRPCPITAGSPALPMTSARADRPRRGEAQPAGLRDLAQIPAGREPADGVGVALGPRRAGLASRMLGDEPAFPGCQLRHPHGRDRPPRDPSPQ